MLNYTKYGLNQYIKAIAIWAIHFEHNKKKSIWPRDLAKAWTNLVGATEKEFMEMIEKF